MRPAQAIRDQEEFPLMRRKRPRFVAARTCSTTFVIIVQSLPSLEGQERERIWHAVEVLGYIRVRVFVVLVIGLVRRHPRSAKADSQEDVEHGTSEAG